MVAATPLSIGLGTGIQNPFSSVGPIGNFMYEGDTLGRGYYQGLANTKTYRDILSMADDAAFDKTKGLIKNPALNATGYYARGLQSLGQSLLGFSPNVGSVNIGGGTIPGRVFYEKVLKNPFARTLGYGTRAFTGLPGLAATGLYELSEQMKPNSALSNFIKQGPANYEKLQNELRLKQTASRALTDAQAAQARREAARQGRKTSSGLDKARERSKDAAAKATGKSRGFFGGR